MLNIWDKPVSETQFKDYSEITTMPLDDNNMDQRFNATEFFNVFVGFGLVI